jgi:signal transduction histidine kinase
MDPHKAQATLEQFATFLSARREEIATEWMNGVQSDGRLQNSERLSASELKAHLPRLFGNLADLLRSPANFAAQKDAGENARIHGTLRFEQGYRLEELLRELARIRAVLIVHTLVFESQTPAFTGMVKRVALQRLHGFFDELICDSAAQFTGDQQAELRGDVDAARANASQARESRREAQEEHSAAQGDIQQLQEVDAKRLRLLRTVAHELRNSVNAAHLIAQDLKDESNPEAQRELTAMLARNVTHMGALLKDLLDYALVLERPKTLRMEEVDIAELCEDLFTAYGALAEAHGLELAIDCDPALGVVTSHRTKIVQIATNLLSNAIKYTAQGQVKFWARALDEDRWSLGVEDTGAGMASEERDQLFREFHRAKDTSHVPGTGLGLSIVKRLVELLEGEIHVESEQGKGSRFEVIFPRAGTSNGNPR